MWNTISKTWVDLTQGYVVTKHNLDVGETQNYIQQHMQSSKATSYVYWWQKD
jgi:hypothetical protein